MKENVNTMLKIMLKNMPLLAGIAQNVENVDFATNFLTPYNSHVSFLIFYFTYYLFFTFLT